MTVQSRSDNLWVVDNTKLYLYSADFPYFDNSQLIDKEYDAHSVIEFTNGPYTIKGDDIEVNYIWRRPIQGMVKHRVSVTKPDGTQKSIENGVEVAYHTDGTSWVFGEPKKRMIRASDIFTLDQYGEYIYQLEVMYADETTSVDTRIMHVVSQNAKAEFDLSALGIPNSIVGVDFDSEHKLWVLDTAGGKYEVNKHYDVMLIDFNKKII